MRICRIDIALALLLGLVSTGTRAERLSAEVEVVLQACDSVAGVGVDCAALLRAAGCTAPFLAESVVVRPAEATGAAAALESRADPIDGIWRVLWRVPRETAKDKVGTGCRFVVEFGSEAASAGTPRLAPESARNLIDNGGFERTSADGVPAGMHAATFSRDFRLVADDRDGNALAFNADPEGHGPSFVTPWVAVEGGQTYVYSFRHRAVQAEAHPRYKVIAYGYVNYRDADGKALPRKSLFGTRLGDTGGWKEFSSPLSAPREARWANLRFSNGSREPYAVHLDDVRIVSAALPQITVAQTAAGRRVSLRVEDPDIRRFDLGLPNSPVWDGFEALTPEMLYAVDTGFGFTAPPARALPSDRGRPEALSRDFITAARADLRVDLPNGEYRVWLLAGDAQGGSTVFWIYRDQRLHVNGEEVMRRDPAPVDFFRTTYLAHYHDFWQPGMDYYDTFVQTRFETWTCAAAVTDGRLLVSWRNLPVAAMVIYPVRVEGAIRTELTRLAADRKRATSVEEVPGPEEDALTPTAAETQRGYVLFRRPVNESVFPSSRPRPEERLDGLRCFAAPGESEPVHFSLWPLRDLGPVRVSAADLVSGDHRIPADAIDVRVVRYVFKGISRGGGAYRYRVAPYFLDRRERVEVTDSVTWSWWAVARVPETAAAGVYQGAILITSGTGDTVRVPWSLRVLPLRLAPLPILQGFYYSPEEPWYATFWGANIRGPRIPADADVLGLIEENERRVLRFMKSLGLNSAAMGDDLRGDLELVDGRVRFKPDSRFVFWMDIYRDEGMGAMPFYGFQPIGAANRLSWLDRTNLAEPFTPVWNAAYRSYVEEAQRVGKARGWPEIIWYISDELSNHGEEGAKLGVELGKALAGMPGVRTIASMNGSWEHIMVPHVTISMPNIAFPITEETVAMVRATGSELWLYNCGDERLNLGLYPWRVQAGGRFQWHYHGINGDPWDDLDGTRADTDYCLGLPAPDGIVPAIKAQIVREAVDDHRYIATLEQAIAGARDNSAKKAVVAKAERFLDDLRARIPVDFRTLVGFQVDPRAAGAALGGEFKNTDALDRVRWAAAQLIVELGVTN